MRRLVPILAILGLICSSFGAITRGQTGSQSHSAASSGNVVLGGAATTGSAVIVVFTIDQTAANTQITSVTDTASNTYNLIDSNTLETGTGPFTPSGQIFCYAAYNVTGGFTTITANFTGTNAASVLEAVEYKGVAPSPQDQHVLTKLQQSASPYTSGSVTTTLANEVLFGYCGIKSGSFSFTAGTGYGNGFTKNNLSNMTVFSEDQIVSSTGSYTASMTGSGSQDLCVGILTLKAASTQGPLQLQLTGIGL